MKKFTEEQKFMIMVPPTAMLALTGLVVPICLADRGDNPWALLLWVPGAVVVGVLMVLLSKWINHDKK